ncbi:Transcriptional regulator, LysR-family [Cupriavidus taiwanensis]|uniref:LysR family transcriptional regulator n=1 Tax=Cupriavidus taiwanensis TaxID=164546 RepID=UPI000E14FBA2|nr:LysR substrate-binding domain-containing protein [Cupriavidus taiwanensis]SOZ13871.1 Transcriptional regulator, LysR-family [Cupriavidus taiwanensis]SOZ24209.1 Transcriptional regulator, LysR-family [Cupriavidus taiwanensis]SOZ44483.1 Transcriptional regulator, LysR-family [Cupriavidus taiwanensis]SPA17493.1 Transcriptional regulator, LysR-family [Cupriavidus taiwanensis]
MNPASAARGATPLPSRIDRLRIRHLRLLDLVARNGSLTAAGEVLHLSQPAVTKMLQELELAFGCKLIERTTRGGRLSLAGERALERLRVVLGAIDAAGEALLARPEVPLVRLGMLPLVGVDVLPRAVARLRAQGSLPRLAVREHSVAGLAAMLSAGELDCIVGRLQQDDAGQLKAGARITRLRDEYLAVVCAPGHPLAGRRGIALADLHEGPWILPPRGTHTRDVFEQPFLDSGQLPPVPHIESASFHSNLAMTAAGDFLTVAPATALAHYQAMSMVREVRLRVPFASGHLVFITPAAIESPPAVDQLREALVAVTAQDGGLPPAPVRRR